MIMKEQNSTVAHTLNPYHFNKDDGLLKKMV